MAKHLSELGAHAFGPPPLLALVDVTQTLVALWARASGIPLVLLNTSLPQIESKGVPPLRSGLSFSAGALGRVQSQLAWETFLTKRKVSAALARTIGLCPPYALARAVAPRFGIDDAALDTRTVYMPQLKGHHELVFCPKEFDFPRPEDPLRHYVESIDTARSEPPLQWEHLGDDKPLVYCALGGQLYRAADTPRFLRRVVKLFARRPELNLVLATGRHTRPEALQPLPPNVLVVERAPQLALLARARAMITHGGLGSIKECLLHGVPMLVFPLAVDQPGNAARVVHHGLGLSGDVRRTNLAELSSKLDRVLYEPSFAQRCRAFQGTLQALERGEHGADLVEGFVARPERLLARTPARGLHESPA